MPFFIRNKDSKRAKLPSKKAKPGERRKKKLNNNDEEPTAKKQKPSFFGNDEVSSESEDESQAKDSKLASESSSESEEETAEDKRLRLAKHYLAQLAEQEAGEESDDETTRGAISDRLKQDMLEQKGKHFRQIADLIAPPEAADIRVLRGHQLPVTCIAVSPDDKYIFSASKDCCIIKWELETGKKIHKIPGGRKGTETKHIGHTAHVLCLAISSDGKFLASGDTNKLIYIWNPETCERIHIFKGHRDTVSGLAFRKGTHQMFSASHDRTVKIWDLDNMAYVETLFGHQDIITGVDSLSRDRAITAGGRDGSVRVWKVVEESQLVFHGHSGCIDCISLMNEEHFVTGADDNSIAVWGAMKKKPFLTLKNAHSASPGKTTIAPEENWITSIISYQHSDLIASGSKDGCIRLWKCSSNYRTLTPLHSIPVVGFVNGLKFTSNCDYLVAGVGQEHRLGRWWRMKEAKNSVCIIKLNRST